MIPNIEPDYTLFLGMVYMYIEHDLTGFNHKKARLMSCALLDFV